MKDFFANLIDRHRGRAETVVPRVHSHFEDASGPDRLDTGDSSQTGQVEQNLVAVSLPGLPESKGATPLVATDRSLIRSEPPAGRNTGQADAPQLNEHDNDPVSFSENRTPPLSAYTLDTEQRIDAVLERLQRDLKPRSGEGPATDWPGGLEQPRVTPIANGPPTDDSPGVLQEGLLSSVTTGHPDAAVENTGSDETGSQGRQNRGDLEIPDWLKQRQSEFGQQLTQINRTSEPVVNVTIGRVEVKAVREPKPKARSSSAKPSGVMSLDEYLGKRQRRGPV